MKKAIWKVFKTKSKRWFFNLTAPNGEIILQSEGYNRKKDAYDTIKQISVYAQTNRFSETKVSK